MTEHTLNGNPENEVSPLAPESLLPPEGPIEELELAALIDAPSIQALMDDFYFFARIPMAISDLKGQVLVGVGWQEICTRFHRLHPETCRHCLESDLQLTAGVAPGECRLYKCKNNMWDIATPIVVDGRRVGNIFSGQFFFEDEVVNQSLFRAQARRHGFDEAAYLAVLEAVPRLSREAVDRGMAFLMKLSKMLSQLSLGNIKLARSLSERKLTQETLQTTLQRFYVILSSMYCGLLLVTDEGRVEFANQAFCDRFGLEDAPADLKGLTPQTMLEKIRNAYLHPDESLARIQEILDRGEPVMGEELALRGGQTCLRDFVPLNVNGKSYGRLWIHFDITGRKHAEMELHKLNRTLRALSSSNQVLMHAADEAALLEAVCQIFTQDCGYEMVWIGYAEQDAAKTVRPVAHAGFEEGYLETLKITWADDERGRGPTGMASLDATPMAA